MFANTLIIITYIVKYLTINTCIHVIIMSLTISLLNFVQHCSITNC